MSRSSQKPRRTLTDYFVPHHGNRFHPLFFTIGGAIGVFAVIFVLQGSYLLDTGVLQHRASFTASVLPSVLAQLTNQDREASGVAALTVNPLLSQAAQLKANDMATNGYFAHVSPTGKTPWYWLGLVGYQYTYAGENLAVDFTDSQDVESAWMASPTHHANIVKPQYTQIGFGVAQGMYEGHETTFVVEDFATPPDPSAAAQPAAAPATPSVPPAASAAPASSAAAPATADTAPAAPQQTAAQVIAIAKAQVAEASSAPQVLGAQTINVPTVTVTHAGLLANVLASPTHTITYALAILAAILTVVLAVTLLAHARVQYAEVSGVGLVMVSVVLIFLMYNQVWGSGVVVPDSGQSAAVVGALP